MKWFLICSLFPMWCSIVELSDPISEAPYAFTGFPEYVGWYGNPEQSVGPASTVFPLTVGDNTIYSVYTDSIGGYLLIEVEGSLTEWPDDLYWMDRIHGTIDSSVTPNLITDSSEYTIFRYLTSDYYSVGGSYNPQMYNGYYVLDGVDPLAWLR